MQNTSFFQYFGDVQDKTRLGNQHLAYAKHKFFFTKICTS